MLAAADLDCGYETGMGIPGCFSTRSPEPIAGELAIIVQVCWQQLPSASSRDDGTPPGDLRRMTRGSLSDVVGRSRPAQSGKVPAAAWLVDL